jgi:hypothetical protein
MKIKMTFTEEALGTKAANKKVFADFIASKHPSGTPQRDELDNAEHREEAGTTIFHTFPDGKIGIYDYQIKGFFKEACGSCNRMDSDVYLLDGIKSKDGSKKLTAYKTKIDGCIFVFPRMIPAIFPEGQEDGVCERPLLAATAQGPRVTLARSQTIPVGTTIEFDVQIYDSDLKEYVVAWFKYGALRGMGAWRNSGKGRFTFEILPEDKMNPVITEGKALPVTATAEHSKA